MASHGFKRVDSDLALVLKRQNFNTNRAIAVVELDALPPDFGAFVRDVRLRVAKQCGYIVVLWPIGIQLVVVAPGLSTYGIDPSNYLAVIDTQWALVQSIFLVDPRSGTYQGARTWGQFVTGKWQDAIEAVLSRHFQR